VTVAVDTSVAVPLLVRSHQHHPEVVRWWAGQELALSGYALAETYSVLTRLPGDAREHGVALATRDARARGTYDAVGVTVVLVA
jgi:toxin FitB